jgi:hypothetical protein
MGSFVWDSIPATKKNSDERFATSRTRAGHVLLTLDGVLV